MSILHQNATLRCSNTPATREFDWMNGSRHNKNASRQTDAQRFLPLLERKIFSGPSLRSFEYSMLIYTEASKLKKWYSDQPYWQWSRRRTLTPSTKRVSHRRSLLKGVAVHRVLYQSILNAKLTGKKNLGMERCTSNRDDRKLENTVKQSWFKHLGELHKEWTEAGVGASRVTTLRRLQEKGYQATSEPETTSEASYLGCGEKELDCCSVVQSPLFRWK